MMTTLAAVALMASLATASVDVKVDGAKYRVVYEYDTMTAVVPATMGGKPHHNASYRVYRKRLGRYSQYVGEGEGQYVNGGCFDADPIEHVKAVLDAE